MRFRVPRSCPLIPTHHFRLHRLPAPRHLPLTGLARGLHAARSSFNGGGSRSSSGQGKFFLVPGATVATIAMLGILHARRLYDDKKVDDMKDKGIELEFSPDAKAAFLRLLPLRSMSRFWGSMTSLELPVWLRPIIYKAWARAFHSSRLFPVNERATRTIRNLHVENERVVLEGQWGEGFMAIAFIGATNVGSIKLFIEPELRTNRPIWKMWHSEPPDERIYEPEGTGVMIKKGAEIAVFEMGSTVVLVFQAPISEQMGKDDLTSDFKFGVRHGDRIKVGEAIGRWGSS